MKNHVIDNSLKNLGKTVLWQYDKAVRLLSILKHIQVLFHCAVEQLWEYWRKSILSVDSMDAMGCSIWGMFLGVPRPHVKDESGNERLIATSVYRKVLKGAFYMMQANSTFSDILSYLEIVFGISGADSLSKWSVHVSEYGWTTNIDELNDEYKPHTAYKKGDIFWYHEGEYDEGQNYLCNRNISIEENVSIEAIEDAITFTKQPTNLKGDDDTILLKLYDPEGVCRKIGGSPKNSLSITVDYIFGETKITAVATRRCKCGIMLIDNGNMSMTYTKSEFYDEMHKDQKALFEQLKDEYCPYPLGIKTNEPCEEVVFGFTGQENALYESGRSYSKGDIFGYVGADGYAYNYKCKEDIDASINLSFRSIESKLDKTGEGDKFIGGLVDCSNPWDVDSINQFFGVSQSLFPDFYIDRLNKYGKPDYFTPVFCIRKGTLVPGRENGLMYIYKTKDTGGGSSFYTDNETYKVHDRGPIWEICTKKMIEAFRGKSYSKISYYVNGIYWQWEIPPDFMERYGLYDAIGKFSEAIKKPNMEALTYTEATKPIDGVQYRETFPKFTIDGKIMVKVGTSYRPISRTTVLKEN